VGDITVTVPYGTNLGSLKAEIDLAAPTIAPDPGTAQDYTAPVEFTVTPEEGEPRVYTVTVTHLPNTTAAITDIDVTGKTGVVWSGLTITVNLPYNTDITAITPTFTLSPNASILPNNAQNFYAASNNTILYIVTAADGTTKTNYNVRMNVAANNAKKITGFTVDNVSTEVKNLITTSIDDILNTITVFLPSGLSTTFTPDIQIEGSSVAVYPFESDPVDFSSSKVYRVTAADNSTRDYTVSASVKAPAAVTLTGVTSNGTSAGGVTTQLTLNFNNDVTTLTAADITLSGDGTYTKGLLTKAGSNSWALGITGTWLQGYAVQVAVANPIGYSISGSPATTELNQITTTVAFENLTQNGTTGGSTPTGQIQWEFAAKVAGFSLDDITIGAGAGSVEKTGFSVTGLNYTASINVVDNAAASASLSITVTPAKLGYTFNPASRNITVYKRYSSITYNSNGASGSAPSATGPVASHTIAANSLTPPEGKVFKRWNTQSNDSGTMFQPGGTYTGSADITLYAIWALESTDLMVKFGIKQDGYGNNYDQNDVTATFAAVAAYLKTTPQEAGSGTNMSVGMVKIGDYVQLKSLSVDKYGGQGSDITNVANLKVKVVGINPYKDINSNGADSHVVFQFEDVVTTRRMYSDAPTTYAASEMHTYLTVNFLTGLIAAGVPNDALGAINRNVGGSILTASVFLPTEYEVFGANTYAASESNQGRLSAYQNNPNRKKLLYGTSTGTPWWLASLRNSGPTFFCNINSGGGAAFFNNDTDYCGVAPAFCIK
jgi:hypothetical protein